MNYCGKGKYGKVAVGSYICNSNGNATKDRIGMSFTYNHLSLPIKSVKTGTSVDYLYDANGKKLRKTTVVNNTPSFKGGDVQVSGSALNYVFARGNGTIYIYNNQGVQATIPQKYFVKPKKYYNEKNNAFVCDFNYYDCLFTR